MKNSLESARKTRCPLFPMWKEIFSQVLIEQSRLSEADNNGCAVGGEVGGVEGGRGWNRLPGGSRSVCCKAGGRFRGL